jgi:hypothetical protein
MTRDQLKAGFKQLLNRVFNVDAYFERVFRDAAASAAERRRAQSRSGTGRQSWPLRVFYTTAWVTRALLLAWVMATHGQLTRHLRACRRVLRRNAALGPDAFGFAAMVDHWLTYWHFACVTREISGTDFGNIPDGRPTREITARPTRRQGLATTESIPFTDARKHGAITTKVLLAVLICHTSMLACRGEDALRGRAALPWSAWVENAAVQRGYIQPGDFAQFGCPPGWMVVEETAAALRGREISTTYIGTDPPPHEGTITCVAQKEFTVRPPPASAGRGRDPVRRPLAPVWMSTDADGITIGFRREVSASAAVYIARDTPCGPRVIGVRLGDLLKWMADPNWGPKRDFLGMTSGGCPEPSRP